MDVEPKTNKIVFLSNTCTCIRWVSAATVAQWDRAFAPQVESMVFESQLRKTYVVKTGSDSSNAKHSALGESVMGPVR